MEGALAVANRAAFAALPNGPGAAATDADLYAFGIRNAQTVGLLPEGELATPTGTVTVDGGPLLVSGTDTLAALGARLLSPFEQLAREALVWAAESADLSVHVAAGGAADAAVPLGTDSPITASHLHALYADLVDPARPFPLARVVDFLTTRNISLDLQPIPTTPQNPSFTVFPMPPFVAMAVEGETVDFSTGPYAAGPEYQSFVASYFQELAAATPGPAGGPAAARDAGPNTPAAESVAAVLFTDYFAFLLRQLLQDALDLYRAHSHPAAGETLDDVTNRFGISAPGPVPDDAAVVRIGRANQASATFFAPGAELTVRRLSTRVVDGETLRSVAGRLHSTPLQVARAVRDRTGVLQVGSELTIVGGRGTVREGDTLARIAARLATTIDVVVGAAANVPRLLTPLTTLTLPTGAYVVAPGDTLGGIAALHGLTPSQVGQAAADAPDLLFAGVGFALPTLTYAVAGASATSTEAETLASIADRFGTTPAALVGGGNADAPALRPGAEVSFGVTTQVRSGETLRQLAERFGLAQQSGPADLVRALDDTPGLLVPGATLVVARPGTYVVKDGDTLASIADAFSTTAQAITSANPTVDCQPGHPCWYPSPDASLPRPGMNLSAPVGLTIALPPGLTYTVQPNDTVATIAARFTLSAAELVVGSADGDVNLDNAGLLVPLATVALPDIPYVVTPPDTPLRVAQRFGLTVDQLVLTNRDVGFGTVVVPDAEVLPLGVLVDELARAGAFNKPAGALARFLLHGLRLPSPDEIMAATPPDRAALRLYPLYTLTGAQVTPPSPLPGDYAITLSSVTGAGHPTITFPGGSDHVTVLLSSDDREMLGKIAAQLAQQPPIDDTPLAATAYPATVVAPRQYALGKPIPWQAADPPRLVHDPGTSAAAPTVGAPTLYPFPDAVRSQVAATAGLWVDHVADAVKDVHGLLATGFRLVLGAGTHVVTADDTLGSVAQAFGLGVPELADGIADLVGLIAPDVPLDLPDDPGRRTRRDDTLRSLGRGCGPGLLIDLVTGAQATPTAPADQRPLTGFGWATQIDFGLRRVPDPAQPGQFVPTVFEVFGTDPAATDDLAQLLSYLGGSGVRDAITLTVLYSADARSGAGPGLRSDPVDAADVLLLKANLSTRSHPPAATAADEPDAPIVAATAGDALGFLTLLWEAAVTNTGGYYLFYRVASTGSGLPAEIFSQDPTATVSLLATVYASGSSTVALRPFHNTAVVVESLPDPTAAVLATPRRYTTSGAGTSLRAVAAELASAAGTPDGPSVQEVGAANVETRNLLAPTVTITVGGTTHRVVPGDTIGSIGRAVGTGVAAVVDAIAAADGVLNPGATLEVYPGWLSHRGALRAGASGFRVVRADPDPGANDPTATAGGQDDPRTKLEVLFNLIGYRLTGDPESGFAASADGLPVGPAQPTGGPLNSGLTAVAGQDAWTYQKQIRVDRFARSGAVPLGDLQDPYAGVGTSARFGWQYQDVFGNRLLSPSALDVDVRYTDDLVAVSQWPAVLTGYRFTGPPGPVSLVVTLALDTSVYVPTPGEVFAPVGSAGGSAGITARAEAHRDRYAEIFWQVSHDLVAEVTTTVDGATPHLVSVGELATFTATAWGYLQTVARTTQATVPVPDGATLADLAATYHITATELAQANRSVAQNADAANLLGSGRTIVVEARYSVIRNDTLSHIAAQAPSFVQTDEGRVAGDNAELSLQAGRLIVVGTVHPVAAGDTFAGVATGNGLDPAQLGAANAQRSGLLVPGTVVSLSSATAYRVGDGDTLASIATRSAVTVAEVATALAAANNGPLVPGSELIVPVAVTVVAGDTLAVLAGRFTVTAAEFAQANATLAALVPGAEIVLPTGGRYTVEAHDTLASIAAAHDTAVADLAGANADSPDLFRVGTRLTSSYRPRAGDTFTAVAARFAVTPAALGTANGLVAGLIMAEQSVLLGSRPQQVEAGDTFASLAAAAGVTVAALADANAATPGLLTAGVPLALPRHVRVGGPDDHTHTVGPGETLAAIAADRGVDVTLLGAANADVDGFLAAGAVLSYTVPGGRTYRSMIRADDTLSTMALALQAMLAADGVVATAERGPARGGEPVRGVPGGRGPAARPAVDGRVLPARDRDERRRAVPARRRR